jgi:hypothetical protein
MEKMNNMLKEPPGTFWVSNSYFILNSNYQPFAIRDFHIP